MSRRLRPLFVWRLRFRLTAAKVDSGNVAELEQRLHGYRAHVQLESNNVTIRMRVVGHEGPASAVGDAAQQLRHHAANSGFAGAEIIFVSAERVAATA